jgi:hypothetical protein
MKKWSTPLFASLLAWSSTAFAQSVPDEPPPIEDAYDGDDGYDDDGAYDDASAIEEPYLGEPVTLDRFRSDLSPYGRWVDTPEYGVVWIPYISSASWRPYSNGEWRYTRYGWTFISYDPWGGAPFHYGRWIFRARFGGWCWIPGYEWAPAWVSWRYGGGFIAWAPLGPVGISIGYYSTPGLWLAVNGTHFHGRLHHRHFLPTRHVREVVFHRTRDYAPHHRHDSRGPSVDYVTRVTRRPVRTVEVRRAPQPLASIRNENAPSVRAPAPSVRAPAPSVRAHAPSVRAPAPSVRAPAPSVRAPAPSVRAPAPRREAAFGRAPSIRRDPPRAPTVQRDSPRAPSVRRDPPRAPSVRRDPPRAPSVRRDPPRAPSVRRELQRPPSMRHAPKMQPAIRAAAPRPELQRAFAKRAPAVRSERAHGQPQHGRPSKRGHHRN